MKHYYIILSGLFACVFWHVQAQEHRLLRDPYVYETAAEMYAVGDTLPFDDMAALLVANMPRQLLQGLTAEDDIMWDILQKLEPYRKSGEVQKALKIWAEYIREAERLDSVSVASSRHTDNRRLVFPVVQAYRLGEFDEVIALGRKLLSDPEVKARREVVQVVRNNLALALMHENRDLCAQMELELLNAETEIRYFPALINLTVVYERLGKREDAEVLVNRLTEYMEKEKIEMALVNFNAIWFQGEKEDHRSVVKALEMVNTYFMEKQGVPKYVGYREQLAARYRSFPLPEIGFMGKVYTGSPGWLFVYLFYWIGIVISGTRLFKYLYNVFNLSSFLMSLLILLYFVSIFLVTWGIPFFGGWVGLVVLPVGSWFFVLKRVKKIRK
jgi:hypothetical protein